MEQATQAAIALLSSGLDSSVALNLALEEGTRVVLALSFDYGQRAAKKELKQAAMIAKHFGIPHRIIALPWFKEFEAKGLLSSSHSLPTPTTAQLSETKYSKDSAAQVWVPNRNGVMIEVAASIAEDLKVEQLIVGFNKEEAATFPDNSKAYMEALSRSLAFSTQNQIKVVSPTVDLDKSEIIAKAILLHFPFELLWSCYENREKMCGRCESCMRLKRAMTNNEILWEAYFENL